MMESVTKSVTELKSESATVGGFSVVCGIRKVHHQSQNVAIFLWFFPWFFLELFSWTRFARGICR